MKKFYDENTQGAPVGDTPAPAPTTTPIITAKAIAGVIQLFEKEEPMIAQVVMELRPNDPVVSEAVALYPTIKALLDELDAFLLSLPQ